MQPEQVKKPKLYLAGPMSNYPAFNYPAFFKAAKELRDAGYDIVSPAENDSPEVLKKILASPDGKLNLDLPSWGDFLSKDVKLVADIVEGVVTLPGWEKSRGARLESFVCHLTKKPLYVYVGNGVVRTMEEGEFLRGITGLSATLLGSNYASVA